MRLVAAPTRMNASAAPSPPPASRAARWLDRLLHLHDSPHRTALAFALGVFFGFSPFLGLQMMLSFSLAFLLGLNRLAVFVGANVNLPWIMAPWYAGTTLAAAHVLGTGVPVDFQQQLGGLFASDVLSASFWQQTLAMLRPLLVPYLVGPTVAALPVGLVAYWAARALLERRQRDRAAVPSSS